MLSVGYGLRVETPEMRTVREMYETSNRGDLERALEYFHPDVELIVPDTLPDPGVYSRPRRVLRLLSRTGT
jgi:ketosteroid isomerase-like protein